MSNLFKGLRFTITAISMSLTFLIASLAHGQSQEIVVNVEAMDHAFEVDAPDELPSGWITFVLKNEMAHEVHEISFAQLPEGVTYEEYLTDYMGAWSTLLSEFQSGIVERSGINKRVNELLPDWASEVKYINNRGLVSPGRTAEKTVFLEPGKYTMGCWMKTADGIIHIVQGMHKELNITEDLANSPVPNPKSQLTLQEDNIVSDWVPKIGKNAFALDFNMDSKGRSFHNNVHLIRMEENTDLDKVNNWLDWYTVGGLRSPAPADFLGGVEVLNDGATAYFALNIKEPGNYAWIVFVSQGQGVYKTFTVE